MYLCNTVAQIPQDLQERLTEFLIFIKFFILLKYLSLCFDGGDMELRITHCSTRFTFIYSVLYVALLAALHLKMNAFFTKIDR